MSSWRLGLGWSSEIVTSRGTNVIRVIPKKALMDSESSQQTLTQNRNSKRKYHVYDVFLNGLVYGKNYRKPLIFPLNMGLSCKCSLNPIHCISFNKPSALFIHVCGISCLWIFVYQPWHLRLSQDLQRSKPNGINHHFPDVDSRFRGIQSMLRQNHVL